MRMMLLVILVLLPFGSTFADKSSSTWLLITTPTLRDSFEPLLQLRKGQGFRVVDTVIDDSTSTAEAITSFIRDHQAASAGPTFVVLGGSFLANDDAAYVPAGTGESGRMHGRRTDYAYGLPQADGVPLVFVGRLPARSSADAEAMVKKILRSEEFQLTDETVHLGLVVANPGGKTAFEKRFAETFLQITVEGRLATLNKELRNRVVADIAGTEYSASGDAFGPAALELLASGCVFDVFCGHSSAQGIWSTGEFVVTRGQLSHLETNGFPGVFFSCGCFTCQIDGDDGQGFGLAAIRNPQGPVAVIGPFAESYANFGKLAVDGLESEVNVEMPTRLLGRYWLAVQKGILSGRIDGITFLLFDHADGSAGKVSLLDQRQEHIEMWTLLGDPATRLPQLPGLPQVEIESEVSDSKRPY